MKIYCKIGVIVPFDARCCTIHLDKFNMLNIDEYSKLEIASYHSKLNADETKLIVEGIRKQKVQTLFNQFENYSTIDDQTCFRTTGFRKEEFALICFKCVSLKNSPGRSKEQALAVFLHWLKTGHTQDNIAFLFGIQDRLYVSNYCDQVRQSLINDFVPEYLGYRVCSREELIEKSTETFKELYDMRNGQLAVIMDGTYCYMQKSANNEIQKATYSGQKKRHLWKPFVITTTNGYIIEVEGPFFANESDSTILNELIEKRPDLKNLLLPKDIVILDRGFRESVKNLTQNYKLAPKLPTCNLLNVY